MQAVILAAGRGTRMGHLTELVPKPLLKFRGKNLIEHKIYALPEEVNEIVIIIGYLGNSIKEYFGDYYHGKSIKYVEQGNLKGTGAALFCAKDILKDRFLVMMGDDIYNPSDIRKIMQHEWAILVNQVDCSGKGAKIITNELNSSLHEIVENSDVKIGDLVNTGLYSLRKEIFDYKLVPISNNEFGLPQMLAVAHKDFEVKIEHATNWIQISKPEDLLS